MLSSCCSWLRLWVGYFITLGYTCVLLFDVFNGCSNSIKEVTMNRLIDKGMCVLLLDVCKCSLVQLKK